MTDKELRRLSRADLLELLIIERQEIDRLNGEKNRITQELEAVNQKLETASRELTESQKLLKTRFLRKDRTAGAAAE